jgi:hypothetical protein
VASFYNFVLIVCSGLVNKLMGALSRPSNAPIGPVPTFNPDLVSLLTPLKRSKDNFYIPTDADYTNMLEHLLAVAYGTAEVIVNATSEDAKFIASQSLYSLAHVYERLSDFRRLNWFRELPGSLRYASLLSEVPSHGEFLFRELDRTTKEVKLLSATEVTEHCEKAKEAYKKLRTSTYVLFGFSVVLFLPALDMYLFPVSVPTKRPRSSRETGSAGAAGARVAPAPVGRTRRIARSSTGRKRSPTRRRRTTTVLPPARNAAGAAAVAARAAGAARRRRRTPSSCSRG